MLLVGLTIRPALAQKTDEQTPKQPTLMGKCDLGSPTRIVLLDARNADLAEIQIASRISVPAILTGNREKRHCLLLKRSGFAKLDGLSCKGIFHSGSRRWSRRCLS